MLHHSLALLLGAALLTTGCVTLAPLGGVDILGVPEDKITSAIPARRLGKPEELGALVTFLASEQAGCITGQSVVIDGGWMRGF